MAEVSEHQKCASPLCSVEFEPSGLAIKPRRFCSDQCKQEASLIRGVAKLYGLEIAQMHEALTTSPQTRKR